MVAAVAVPAAALTVPPDGGGTGAAAVATLNAAFPRFPASSWALTVTGWAAAGS